MAESGIFYSAIIDPLLIPVRQNVIAQINEGESVIDVASGTGALVFECSKKAGNVLGVDLSESMFQFAQKRAAKNGCKNVTFILGDATRLNTVPDGHFDAATITMALHQFHPKQYAPVLNELKRVAGRIIIVDYSAPLPKNPSGFGSRLAEFIAGGEHLKHFKLYQKEGGLLPVLKQNRLKIIHEKRIGYKAFHLVVCSK